jgi:hypothetical protein
MNDLQQMLAEERNLDPNRRLGDALTRNRTLNMQQNLGGLLEKMESMGGLKGYGQGGMQAADFNRGLADAYLRSASQGINPMLQKELGNIAGVHGLEIEGQKVSEDYKPDLKGAGAAEIGFGGLSSFFGGK